MLPYGRWPKNHAEARNRCNAPGAALTSGVAPFRTRGRFCSGRGVSEVVGVCRGGRTAVSRVPGSARAVRPNMLKAPRGVPCGPRPGLGACGSAGSPGGVAWYDACAGRGTTAGEVLGGTHPRWRAGHAGAPSHASLRDGSSQVVARSGRKGAVQAWGPGAHRRRACRAGSLSRRSCVGRAGQGWEGGREASQC